MWSGSFRIRVRIKFVCNKVAVFNITGSSSRVFSQEFCLLFYTCFKKRSLIADSAIYFLGTQHTVPPTIFDDQFLFLICKCLVEKIWYFFKKEMKMTKTQVLWWKATKHVRKVHPTIAFSILNLPYWPIM